MEERISVGTEGLACYYNFKSRHIVLNLHPTPKSVELTIKREDGKVVITHRRRSSFTENWREREVIIVEPPVQEAKKQE